MEGDLSIVQCVSDKEEVCDKYDKCATVKLWSKINDAIEAVTDSITLADLLGWDDDNEIPNCLSEGEGT